MFFQNHVNHLDHCTAYCATRHFKQGVELEEHFRYPIYGRYMRSRGTIPVRRGDAAQLRELIKRMRDEIAQGHSLLVFPEGTRTLTGQLGEFQPGVFRIVQQIGAPIVPVTVTGMYRVMRKGSYLIRPGYDVTVYCDAPIETRGLSRRDVPALMERVRIAMGARLDEDASRGVVFPGPLRRRRTRFRVKQISCFAGEMSGISGCDASPGGWAPSCTVKWFCAKVALER